MPKYKVQVYGPTYFVIANDELQALDLVEGYLDELDINKLSQVEAEEDETIPEDLCINAPEE